MEKAPLHFIEDDMSETFEDFAQGVVAQIQDYLDKRNEFLNHLDETEPQAAPHFSVEPVYVSKAKTD